MHYVIDQMVAEVLEGRQRANEQAVQTAGDFIEIIKSLTGDLGLTREQVGAVCLACSSFVAGGMGVNVDINEILKGIEITSAFLITKDPKELFTTK